MIFAGVNGTEGVKACRRTAGKWQTLSPNGYCALVFGLYRRLRNDGPKCVTGGNSTLMQVTAAAALGLR
jgi:hypothetical protein